MTKSNEAYVVPLTRPGMALDDYDNVTGTFNNHRINKPVVNGKHDQVAGWSTPLRVRRVNHGAN